MKTNLLKLTCGLALLGAAATAPAQSTFNISLTDDGSGNTAISWTASGDLVSPGGAIAANGVLGYICFYGLFPGYVNNLGSYVNTDIPFSGSGYGTLTDLSNSASQPVWGVGFYSGDQMYLWLNNEVSTTSGTGTDVLRYTAGTDSAVVAVPYASFNPGTYQYVETGDWMSYTKPVTYNLTVGAVPEPSSLALAGLGGLGMLWQLRRRK